MNLSSADPIQMMMMLGFLSLVPLMIMVTTCFLKFIIVLSLTRNALGVQQIPPTMVLQAIALAMTVFVMTPTISEIYKSTQQNTTSSGLIDNTYQAPAGSMNALPGSAQQPISTQNATIQKMTKHLEPLRQFMIRFTHPDQLTYFLQSAKRIWPKEMGEQANKNDFMILIPAFVVSELQTGFEIGFLIFLPFVVIDLVISNILMALGMQQVSPNTVSLPLKIFLFVMVDGWAKLLHSLVESYV